jgi:hypothetical protein
VKRLKKEQRTNCRGGDNSQKGKLEKIIEETKEQRIKDEKLLSAGDQMSQSVCSSSYHTWSRRWEN